MRILALDKVVQGLEGREEAELYGLSEAGNIILISLEKARGLKRIGLFRQDKKDLINTSLNEEFTFYLKGSSLLCIHNPGVQEPIEITVSDIIKYSTDFNKRNHGIVDESGLQEKTVSIIGLGSVGSALACDLTRSSVTNFNLIEFDTVSVSNLCRSAYDLLDVGRKKTDALFEKLIRLNPCINANLYDIDILGTDQETLIEILQTSDLIIDASDSIKTKILINGLFYNSKPIIYPSVYDLGKGGDILFTIPGLPCFECVFSSIMDEIKQVKKGDWDYTTGTAKPMPALLSDIQVVNARTVKLALAILTSDQENSFIEKVTEPGCSLLLIGNERNAFIFDKPFQEIWAETEIDPNCTCQTLA